MSDIPSLRTIDTAAATDSVEVVRITGSRVLRFKAALSSLVPGLTTAVTTDTAQTITGAKTFSTGGVILDDGTKTATAAAGAATLNKLSGKITSESLTTAAQAAYALTLTNSTIAAADIVLVAVANGTNSAGIPVVGTVAPASGSAVIKIENQHATAAFNGTVVVSFAVIKAA